MNSQLLLARTVLAASLCICAVTALAATATPLTVNWYHEAQYLQPVIDAFTKETGIAVRVTDAYDKFDTDVILISDYKTLTEAKKLGALDVIRSAELDAIVPPRWRDRDGYWYGVALRTRAVVYNKAQVKTGEIKALRDLMHPRWRGRIALRSAANVYNRSLLAQILVHEGHDTALEWARAVRANAGDAPEYSGDTGNIWRVAKGEFALSFVNTYYIGYVLARSEEQQEGIRLGDTLGIAWLDQDRYGQPVNVTGVGVSSETERRDDAVKLVSFLLSRNGQSLLSKHVFKYPVRADVGPSPFLKAQGFFRMDELNLNDLELHYDEVDGIFRAVGWASWGE